MVRLSYHIVHVHETMQSATNSIFFHLQSVSGTNVIGIMKGSLYKTAADDVLVLAAHTDTPDRNTGGANNDGSGLVGLLAIAEALKGNKGPVYLKQQGSK